MPEGLSTNGRTRRVLLEAAIAATAAPSVYNAQPWRLLLRPDRVEVHADPERMLYHLDRVGRQLHISCGCALFNAMTAVAAAGRSPAVRTLPSAARPDLLGSVAPGPASRSGPVGALHRWVPERRTPRARLDAEGVDAAVTRTLRAAARAEGAALEGVDADTRPVLAELQERAVRSEPRLVGSLLPPAAEARDAPPPGLFVLSTRADDRASWIVAGRALQRVLLELTARQLSGVPLMQVVECAATRSELARLLPGDGYPQMVLRAGRAAPEAPVRRRRLVEVLAYSSDWDAAPNHEDAPTGSDGSSAPRSRWISSSERSFVSGKRAVK